MDDLAQELIKGVTSCDKLWGDARGLRSTDSLMGYPPFGEISLDWERGELNHLSTRRKRKQLRCC